MLVASRFVGYNISLTSQRRERQKKNNREKSENFFCLFGQLFFLTNISLRGLLIWAPRKEQQQQTTETMKKKRKQSLKKGGVFDE
jgi:cytoskeletal protein RodZ